MASHFSDILNHREENYLIPFLWQRGSSHESIPALVERVFASGCRAFCVESRPHPDFCGDGWWRDMDLLLCEAKKRGMKVWILDDDHFPTGHANGGIAKRHPEAAQWTLTEDHIDVAGPRRESTVFLPTQEAGDVLLGAFAYPRNPDDAETCIDAPIDLTDRIRDDLLCWDIPAGVWRIFFYFRSRRGGKPEYIDMLNPASVDVLIEEVYEKHWEHYADEFGKTIAGFFSDEPGFGNNFYRNHRIDRGSYEKSVGRPGLALPWNDIVRERMQKILGSDPLPHLYLLWYDEGGQSDRRAAMRYAYMDTVSAMYRDCFSLRIGNWCRAHGVEYIGHVIEDCGTHARLCYGSGHYFRALAGQDMAGMDIVLHQVLPGMSDLTHTASVSDGAVRGPFFHYMLGKMCASLAHLEPKMKNRALCEVFGAYGWGEDLPLMKWLLDFLLVRGINHFVPHAFSPDFPDGDCPPHFGANGHDPSFTGFRALMHYANRAAHLLKGTTHVANVALLYHAEEEWASKPDSILPDELIAAELYDNHLDYDIVPFDFLSRATVSDHKLHLAKERFDCLIVPGADHIPAPVLAAVEKVFAQGLPVFFVEQNPEPHNAPPFGTALPLSELASFLHQRAQISDVIVPAGCEKLRIYHARNGKQETFLLFNEDPGKIVDATLLFPCHGDYIRADLLNERYFSGQASTSGAVPIHLLPGESVFLLFGEEAAFPPEQKISRREVLRPVFELELADAKNPWLFAPAGKLQELKNITSPDFLPHFSGKMRYTFRFRAETGRAAELDLGQVGQIAELTLNGIDLGIRICPPYRFDIADALKDGENTAVVTVSNTLVWQERDRLSRFLSISPSGLLGEVALLYGAGKKAEVAPSLP